MKTIITILLLTFSLSFSQTESDKITFTNDSTINCIIITLTHSYVVLATNQDEYISTTRIKEIYLNNIGTVFTKEEGFLKSIDELDSIFFIRRQAARSYRLTIGIGGRSVDSKIENHLGGFLGPVYFQAGYVKDFNKYPIGILFDIELGIGGQVYNSYTEMYRFANFKLGMVWDFFHFSPKTSLFVSSGIMNISSTIDDNADGDEGFFTSDVEFHDGELEVSDSGVGYFFEFGLQYFIEDDLSFAGKFQLSEAELDFRDFKSNALGFGFGLKVQFYFHSY